VTLLPRGAEGGVELVDTDDFSLELGLRIQPRMELEWLSAPGGGRDWQRDFMIRRTRIKADGEMRRVRYAFEWKIDRTEQAGANPTASVENAYVEFPLGTGIAVRAGLYDQPFSRDRLISDSKQLAVDRGAVSNVPDALGLADNAVGFHVLGRVRGGRAQYALGLFDNRLIPARDQDLPMIVGRLDLNFGETKDVFRDVHFGQDSWISLGVNGSYQGMLEDTTGADGGSNGAFGIDGMIDVPTCLGRLFTRSEVVTIRRAPPGGTTIGTTIWAVACGLLVLDQRLQPLVRFDQVRLDEAVGGGTRNTTCVGANLYLDGYRLKLQGDVRLEAGTEAPVDGARLQLQLDF
jgi:hypothetical protein